MYVNKRDLHAIFAVYSYIRLEIKPPRQSYQQTTTNDQNRSFVDYLFVVLVIRSMNLFVVIDSFVGTNIRRMFVTKLKKMVKMYWNRGNFEVLESDLRMTKKNFYERTNVR